MTHYPAHLTLELTAKCNFRCPYCYCIWHENSVFARPELTTAGWTAVLEKCAADEVKDILFTGGEVLLRPDLFKILDAARRLLPKARLTLFTNASRLTESHLRRFKCRKIHLATSLQGLRTYGEMTGTKRSYKRLLTVLARAAELKWPIAVSMTITKANQHEAVNMFVAAVLSGARAVQLVPMMAGGRAFSHLGLMISRAEWKKIQDDILAVSNLPVRPVFGHEFICECRPDTPPELSREWSDPQRKPCPAGKSFGVVGPNGRYRTCLHMLSDDVNCSVGKITPRPRPA